MRSSLLSLDEAEVLLRNEVEKLIDHESNEVKRLKLSTIIDLLDAFDEIHKILEVVLRFWPGLMLSFVEALYDEARNLVGLRLLELIKVDAVVETQDEELAESIEDSQ